MLHQLLQHDRLADPPWPHKDQCAANAPVQGKLLEVPELGSCVREVCANHAACVSPPWVVTLQALQNVFFGYFQHAIHLYPNSIIALMLTPPEFYAIDSE
jgi:hypothetical protein